MSPMTNKFDVIPYERVGCINFGDTRKQVLQKLGQPSKSLILYDGQTIPRDAYYELGVFVHYSEHDGIVELIEVFEPSEPMFQGINLFNCDYRKPINALRSLGYKIDDLSKTYVSGYKCDELGIGFFISNDSLGCVAFYKKGYTSK